MAMKNKFPEFNLPLKQIKEGECFLCGEPCIRYCHTQCAMAYSDEKDKRLREWSKQCDEIHKNNEKEN